MGEPWVKLPTGRDLETHGRDDMVALNQSRRQGAKWQFFRDAMDYVADNGIRGDYLEFGCHRARTFRMALSAARLQCLDDMRFWAFDSFEGLPPSEGHGMPGWTAGALNTSEQEFRRLVSEHGVYVDAVGVVKGFYADTLQQLVAANWRAAMITIDCDLYESAVPVFKFIEPLLQDGTLLYVDDFFSGYRGNPGRGVGRALDEHTQISRFGFVPHMQIGWGGRSFIACAS
jgi:hypothetical protein